MATTTTLQPAPVKDCGKRTYPNKPIAQKLARRTNDSGERPVQPYHCTRCHGWHLGHSPARKTTEAFKRRAAFVNHEAFDQ